MIIVYCFVSWSLCEPYHCRQCFVHISDKQLLHYERGLQPFWQWLICAIGQKWYMACGTLRPSDHYNVYMNPQMALQSCRIHLLAMAHITLPFFIRLVWGNIDTRNPYISLYDMWWKKKTWFVAQFSLEALQWICILKYHWSGWFMWKISPISIAT